MFTFVAKTCDGFKKDAEVDTAFSIRLFKIITEILAADKIMTIKKPVNLYSQL